MSDHAELCGSCGHALGTGRYCISCGRHRGSEPPASAGDDVRETAERAAVPAPPPVYPPPAGPPASTAPPPPAGPVPALPVYEAPRAARFPLFADESPRSFTPASDEVEEAPLTLEPIPPSRRRAGAGLVWAAAVVGVVLLLGVGGFLLLDGSGPDSARETGPPVGSVSDDPVPPDDPEDPDDLGATGPASGPVDPGPSDGGSEGDDPANSRPVDVARLAEATPPATAAPSRDVDGNAVRYEAFNMLDAQPDTAWRMPGDGSGREIDFRLATTTKITRVGLVNGYAKVEPGYDGYAANRRIIAVEWVFDDGTVVPQTLTDGLALQSVKIRRVVTDTVTLRIVSVSAPTRGPSGRDYTAISDVALVGTPA